MAYNYVCQMANFEIIGVETSDSRYQGTVKPLLSFRT